MTYSLDFRRKVLEIRQKEQLSFEEAGLLFGVGKQTIYRWSKRLKPKLTRNKPPTKIDREALKKDVEKFPDAYQRERAERFDVTSVGILKALRRLKITYKKNSNSPQS